MDQQAHYEKAEMCLDLSEQADPESADRLLKAAQVHARLAGDYKPPKEWNIGRAKIGQITLTDGGGEAHSTGAALQFPDEPVDVTEEPPVGSTVTVKDGDVMGRHEDGWHLWLDGLGVWDVYRDSWEDILRRLGTPPRLATDADRERVGLPVDTAPDVDPDEALRFIHPDAYDRERKWHGEQRVRAEKAEADLRDEVTEHDKTRATVLRLTRERDDLRARVDDLIRERGQAIERYKALREDVTAHALHHAHDQSSLAFDCFATTLEDDDKRGRDE